MFLRVTVCEEFCPTVMLENETLVGFAVKVAGATPVPDNAMSTVFASPVTVSETFPLSAPAAVGAYFTVKVELWLGVSVSGKLIPESLKPAPVTLAAVIVRFAEPVFFKVSVCVEFVLILMLPKLMLVGLVERFPAATPVPESITVAVLLPAVNVNSPFALPEADG